MPEEMTMPPAELQVFQLLRVIDGDTYEVRIVQVLDSYLFGRQTREMTVRLRPLRVDTPETNRAATRERGLWWKAFAEDWFEKHTGTNNLYIVRLFVHDAFGRWLCEIEDYGVTSNLSDAILEEAKRQNEDLAASAKEQIAEAMGA